MSARLAKLLPCVAGDIPLTDDLVFDKLLANIEPWKFNVWFRYWCMANRAEPRGDILDREDILARYVGYSYKEHKENVAMMRKNGLYLKEGVEGCIRHFRPDDREPDNDDIVINELFILSNRYRDLALVDVRNYLFLVCTINHSNYGGAVSSGLKGEISNRVDHKGLKEIYSDLKDSRLIRLGRGKDEKILVPHYPIASLESNRYLH